MAGQAWVVLTESDLLSTLTVRERQDFGTFSTSLTVPDRVPQILSDIAAEVRGYIQSCERNALDVHPLKIPPSMRAHALTIARWRLLVSIPDYNPGDARQTEYETAIRYFAKVATCEIRPEPSNDPVPNPTPPQAVPHAAEVVSSRPKITGRKKLSGL